jgi:predicted AlkP superfamily phosphohydrolase/phosphomutase
MPRGAVKKADVNKYVDWIIEDLQNLTDPNTGEKLKVEVYKPEEIYSGTHLDKAPNIVFMIEDGTIEIDATVGSGEYLVDGNPFTDWTGTHTRDGVIIAKGPKFKSGKTIIDANIQDITPTILDLYDIPIPTEIDGKVLYNILKEDIAVKDRVVISHKSEIHHMNASLSSEEKVLIEDRLRKLGYLS